MASLNSNSKEKSKALKTKSFGKKIQGFQHQKLCTKNLFMISNIKKTVFVKYKSKSKIEIK